MGAYRLIACLTVPLNDEGERAGLEKEIRKRLKGIAQGANVYFRQDMVDDIETPPAEMK